MVNNENLKHLIFRIQENDRQALSELYSEMKTSVYSLALVYTKSDFDAEDIMQNTFLRIWSAAPSFSGKNAKSWIMMIARNMSLDWIRSSKKRTDLDENIPSKDCFEKITASETVKALFKHLKEEEREIVLMYSQGFTHAEIAEITGRPRPTVIWKYNNALKKLKKISGGDNVD